MLRDRYRVVRGCPVPGGPSLRFVISEGDPRQREDVTWAVRRWPQAPRAGASGPFAPAQPMFENVGMTVNLMPITGIPLPFFSYGGSFFIICSLCLGLAFRVAWDSRQAGYPDI